MPRMISPKVLVPAVIQVLAGLALYLITGDSTALIVTLTGLATAGLGAIAPPATGVKMLEVEELQRRPDERDRLRALARQRRNLKV